jgi:hypothetical protein
LRGLNFLRLCTKIKIKGASLLFEESHSPPTIIKNICKKQPLKRDHKRGACRTAQNFSIRLEKHNNTPKSSEKALKVDCGESIFPFPRRARVMHFSCFSRSN